MKQEQREGKIGTMGRPRPPQRSPHVCCRRLVPRRDVPASPLHPVPFSQQNWESLSGAARWGSEMAIGVPQTLVLVLEPDSTWRLGAPGPGGGRTSGLSAASRVPALPASPALAADERNLAFCTWTSDCFVLELVYIAQPC